MIVIFTNTHITLMPYVATLELKGVAEYGSAIFFILCFVW
jgi:hypothetical protein